MEKITKITAFCFLLRKENIDTDQIIPGKFLVTTKKEGLGKYLFYYWRFTKNGKKRKFSPFPQFFDQTKKILITGKNFGCGSSREHAVWALKEAGFVAVVSSSFADIFYQNALKNRLLPIILRDSELNFLFRLIEKNPKTQLRINLKKQEVILPKKITKKENYSFFFPLDGFHKKLFLEGKDELGYLLSLGKKIAEFEKREKIYLKRK